MVGGICTAGFILFIRSGAGRDKTIIFNKNLDLRVMTVDDTAFTLEDIAFYIAYEEMKVEEDAAVYDSTDTNKYWNLHINGEFVRTAAKQHVLDMAVHDYIFCEEADKRGITLDEDELYTVECRTTDFFEDMSEEQADKLGVSEDRIEETVKNIALAQKCQSAVSEEKSTPYENLSVGGSEYTKMLEEHEVVVEAVWEKVRVGNIILEHEAWY